jgi:DNA-binding NarL/FixJ family response regulator
MTIRVLIADDHLFYREGVRTLLGTADEIEIIGESSNGLDVVTHATQLEPDIILMDLKMPGLNGIDATRQIIQKQPKVGILVITMFDDDESVFAVMRAGARGYILKDADQEELVRAITAVYRGEAIFSPAIAQRMMKYFSNVPREGRSKVNNPFPELTERELEILEWIAQGYSNPAIANKLSLSVKTVQNYVSNILSKLQVVDRSEAIFRAREKGLGNDRQ